MDNIKQVVKDVRFLISTNCCDETIQSRIENFINEREQALHIHDVSVSVCDFVWHNSDIVTNLKCRECGSNVSQY